MKTEASGRNQELATAREQVETLRAEVSQLARSLQEANADSRLAVAENAIKEEK